MYWPKIKEQLIYVIKNDETNRIKIGISDNAISRLRALEHASGCKLKMLYFSITLKNARDVEQLIHHELREFRHLGEWFNIDDEEAISTTAKFIMGYGKIVNHSNKESKKDIVSQEYRIGSSRKVDAVKNINLNDYKRIKPGVYADNLGNLYSIKYKMNVGWLVDELKELTHISK